MGNLITYNIKGHVHFVTTNIFKKYVAKAIIEDLKHLSVQENRPNLNENQPNPILKEFLLKIPKKKNYIHQILQPKSYKTNIFTREMLFQKLEYMHNNPVKRNLIEGPGEYIYSSKEFVGSREPT